MIRYPAQGQPEPPLDKTWLARMVKCAISLRDLRMANENYPGAITKKEFDSLESDLSSWIEFGLEQPGFTKFREMFNADDDPTKVVLSIALLEHHPDFNCTDLESHKRVWNACEAVEIGEADKPIRRVTEIRLWNCLVPRPAADNSYREPNRHLRLIDLYWRALKPIIHCEMNAYQVYTRHPLLELILSLRRRVEICFTEITEVTGAVACQEDFDGLVNALVDDPDMLQCATETVQRQIRNMDRFLAEATMKLSPGGLELTREESDFLVVFNANVGTHIEETKQGKANVDRYLKRIGEERRAAANKDPMPASASEAQNEASLPQTGTESLTLKNGITRPGARFSKDKLEQAIQFIKAHPGAKALTIAKRIDIALATFRSNYRPALYVRGVRNDGDGYYIPDS